MSQTIRRGAKPRAAPRVRRAQPKKPPLWERLISTLPIEPETVQRAATWGVLIVIGGAAIGLAQLLGLPAMAGVAVGEAVGRAGFEVKTVDIRGLDRMERLTVYAVALEGHSTAMPLVDLGRIRSDLERYGWVKQARVSRRLPDTLVIDIVERKPAAIWQHEGKLALVDGEGVVLEAVPLDDMPELPLVIGPGANVQIGALKKLVESAPALKPMLAGATWIGGRRWDLRFQSGEVLALPEGDGPAARALQRFALMDGRERLLGRGFARFDMRDPTKLVVRMGKKQVPIDAINDDATVAPPPAVEPLLRDSLGPIQRASQTT